jgi:hypothetical protein
VRNPNNNNKCYDSIKKCNCNGTCSVCYDMKNEDEENLYQIYKFYPETNDGVLRSMTCDSAYYSAYDFEDVKISKKIV